MTAIFENHVIATLADLTLRLDALTQAASEPARKEYRVVYVGDEQAQRELNIHAAEGFVVIMDVSHGGGGHWTGRSYLIMERDAKEVHDE